MPAAKMILQKRAGSLVPHLLQVQSLQNVLPLAEVVACRVNRRL